MSTLWSAWAPPTERSRLAGIANAGAQIGNVFDFCIFKYYLRSINNFQMYEKRYLHCHLVDFYVNMVLMEVN